MDPMVLGALADAVVERLAPLLASRDERPHGELVDAATLARLLGVSRSSVYAHAAELGAQRLGDGPRARLRFDVEVARAAMGCCVSEPSQAGGNASNASVSAQKSPPAMPHIRASRRHSPNAGPKAGTILRSRPKEAHR